MDENWGLDIRRKPDPRDRIAELEAELSHALEAARMLRAAVLYAEDVFRQTRKADEGFPKSWGYTGTRDERIADALAATAWLDDALADLDASLKGQK